MICRRTLGVLALKADKQTEAELHRTYDNLTAAYSTEVRHQDQASVQVLLSLRTKGLGSRSNEIPYPFSFLDLLTIFFNFGNFNFRAIISIKKKFP